MYKNVSVHDIRLTVFEQEQQCQIEDIYNVQKTIAQLSDRN